MRLQAAYRTGMLVDGHGVTRLNQTSHVRPSNEIRKGKLQTKGLFPARYVWPVNGDGDVWVRAVGPGVVIEQASLAHPSLKEKKGGKGKKLRILSRSVPIAATTINPEYLSSYSSQRRAWTTTDHE
jgi:hypothetical protein